MEVASGDADAAIRELDEAWVNATVEQALETLRAKNELYYQVIRDLLETEGEGSPDLGERLGRRQRQLDDLKYRARKRFATVFNDELRTTVKDDEAFEELFKRLEVYLP